jgi:hypothetical protein
MQTKYSAFCQLFDLFNFDFWTDVAKLYKTDLKQIIGGCPKIKKKIVVYRGIKDGYILNGAVDKFYKSNTFVSTSMKMTTAGRFRKKISKEMYTTPYASCCLNKITLLPGSRALFLAGLSCIPHELEVLINSDSTFYITKERKFISSYINVNDVDICIDQRLYGRTKIEMTELVLVS